MSAPRPNSLGCLMMCLCVLSAKCRGHDTYGVKEIRQGILGLYERYARATTAPNPADLIFVLDRSASVTESGWLSMLRFVQNFLEPFTIDEDNTRVAVISYSSTVSVDIDGISSGQYNKCGLVARLQGQMARKVPRGYSATHDALLRAKDVALTSRAEVKKAVIVITNGKSNVGPPPIRAALKLRSLTWDQDWNVTTDGPQLQVYAFGIKDAYMPEARSIATPLPNHTFYLPTFQAFRKLARSLHDDSQSESWQMLGDSSCHGMCDDHAFCACGIRSGQHLCICRDGYQGDGTVCTACPRGTYKNKVSPSRCALCPSNSTTLVEGATDISHCVCQPPFYQNATGQPCPISYCERLSVIEHGHTFHVVGVVFDEVPDTTKPCLNLPGSSCHFSCDVGYILDGNPGLVCLSNGSWEGRIPSCHIVDCGPLSSHHQAPEHAIVEYVNQTTNYSSVARVTCDRGWRTFGDSDRVCTQYGTWSGTPVWCVDNHCPALTLSPGIIIMPASCGQAEQVPGDVCQFLCQPGYELKGQSHLECTDNGRWDTGTMTECVDILPPSITCAANITTPVTTANFAIIEWKSYQPLVTDNSGEFILTAIGVVEYNHSLHLTAGVHEIKYLARDKAGNEAFCVQRITVLDFIVHLVTCPEEDVTINMISHQQETVWPTVVFADHNNVTVAHKCVPANNTLLPAGIYTVTCFPDTRSYQQTQCNFRAIFRQPKCDIPSPPLHGSVNCSSTPTSILTCIPHCQEGFDFYMPQSEYICDLEGNWNSQVFWPDCSRTYYTRKASLPGHVIYHYSGDNCEQIKEEIANTFAAWLQKQVFEICKMDTCGIESLRVSCGEKPGRKRRSTGPRFINNDKASHYVPLKHQVGTSVSLTNLLPEKIFEQLSDTNELPKNMAVPLKDDSQQSGSTTHNYPKRSVRGFIQNFDNFDADYDNNIGPSGSSSVPPIDYFLDNVTPQSFHDEDTDEVKIEFVITKESFNDTQTEWQQSDIVLVLLDIFDSLSSSLDSYNLTLDDNNATSPSNGSNILYSLSHVIDNPILDACDFGYITRSAISLSTQICVACPVGSKYDYITSQCLVCDPAYYQPNEAQYDCLMCPNDTMTEFSGANSISMCLAQCKSGQFSGTGLSPCQPCPLNSYQPMSTATTCLPCPMGRKTLGTGAVHAAECLELCNPGMYSETGLVPCMNCQVGYYQPDHGATDCLLCGDGLTTASDQAANISDCFAKDDCSSTDLECVENGGTCVMRNNVATCVCPSGFSGASCEINIPDCFVPSCQNNGTCIDGNNTYSCDCLPGFTGTKCEVNIDECLCSPCQHGSSCLDLLNGYQCFCLFDYTGVHCETKTLLCDESVCVNGRCEEKNGAAVCMCNQGFAGHTCNTTIDLCSSHPCTHDSRCESIPGHFQCHCLQGFTGALCNTVIDPCDNSNCSQHSLCMPVQNGQVGYLCKCSGGWSGKFCEYESTGDFDLVFDANGSDGQYVVLPPEFMPSLVAFTVCTWLRPQPLSEFATIVAFTLPVPSLAIENNEYHLDKELVDFDTIFAIKHTDKLIVNIFNHSLYTNVTLTFMVWSHLCVTWSCTSSHWQVVVNGSLSAEGTLDHTWTSLPSHSQVVLGQNNPYHAEESTSWQVFAGEITQFNIFSHVLSVEHLQGLANGRACNTTFGDVISWTDVSSYIQGDLVLREISHCLDINECWFPSEFPCGNNKECVDLIGSYNCSSCTYGYTGENCDLPEDECAMDVCARGECVNDGPEPYDFQCLCPSGVTGYLCDGIIDLCLSAPCQNGGTCISGLNNFTCNCSLSMTNLGPLCEIKAGVCFPNPCLNHGLCFKTDEDTFKCHCSENFTGNLCERRKNVCDGDFCHNGGVCQNQSASRNNSVKSHSREGLCRCNNGWMGQRCQARMVPSCDLSPCVNGGSCLGLPEDEQGFRCQCLDIPGRKVDDNCEIWNPCDQSPCADNTLCVHFANFTFICVCVDGHQCEPLISSTSDHGHIYSPSTEKIATLPSGASLSSAEVWAIAIVTVLFILLVVVTTGCFLWRRKYKRSDGEVLIMSEVDEHHLDNPTFHSEEMQLEENIYAELGGNSAEGYASQEDSAKSTSHPQASAGAYIPSSTSGSFSPVRSPLSKKPREEDDLDTPLLFEDYLESGVLERATSPDYLEPGVLERATSPDLKLAKTVSKDSNIVLLPKLGVSNDGFDPGNYVDLGSNRSRQVVAEIDITDNNADETSASEPDENRFVSGEIHEKPF